MGWEYFDEKKFGVVRVGQVDWTDEAYTWDTTTVFYHPDEKKFYWEHDGGCSCNGPLDDVYSLNDLESGSAFDIAKELTSDAERLSTDKYESNDFKVDAGARAFRLIETIFKFNDGEIEVSKDDD